MVAAVPTDFTGELTGADISSWSINAGAFTVNNTNKTSDDLSIWLSDGNVMRWSITADGPNNEQVGSIREIDDTTDFSTTSLVGQTNEVLADPGAWKSVKTDVKAVPEPASMAILGGGLVALAAERRRRAATRTSDLA